MRIALRVSKGSKHNIQSFKELMATNKYGCFEHLDVGCNQGIILYLSPLTPPPPHNQIPEILIDNWWAIYVVISLIHLYHPKSNFWLDPIDHNASIYPNRAVTNSIPL